MGHRITAHEQPNGRWIAEAPTIPGCRAEGATRESAEFRAKMLGKALTAGSPVEVALPEGITGPVAVPEQVPVFGSWGPLEADNVVGTLRDVQSGATHIRATFIPTPEFWNRLDAYAASAGVLMPIRWGSAVQGGEAPQLHYVVAVGEAVPAQPDHVEAWRALTPIMWDAAALARDASADGRPDREPPVGAFLEPGTYRGIIAMEGKPVWNDPNMTWSREAVASLASPAVTVEERDGRLVAVARVIVE